MVFIIPSQASNLNLSLGVILPLKNTYPWSWPKTGPAIQYAVDTINSGNDGFKLNITYGDSQCSETFGPLAAIEMYLKGTANVFLGPACDYAVAPIARFSVYWNIPVISGGAMVRAFNEKAKYGLLTRISTSYAKLGGFFDEVFAYFNWTDAAMIYGGHKGNRALQGKSEYFFTMEAVFAVLNVRYQLKYPAREMWYKDFDVKDESYPDVLDHILKDASAHARVILMCSSPDSVREIMIKAAEHNFDNGEYVFFNIDLFSNKANLERPWYRQNDTDERNEKAFRMYQSLLTITLRRPESDKYRQFSAEVKRLALERYGESVYEKDEEVNNFVGAFHDAVILYALAVNKTIQAGLDPKNGTIITEFMWNRTFEGITGAVSIDEKGDRNGDYSLLDMDSTTGSFRAVGNYYGHRNKYEPIEGMKIEWSKGRFSIPPDKPDCGFDGLGCPVIDPFPPSAIISVVFGVLLILVLVVALFIYRHYKKQADLSEKNWRVRWDDINLGSHDKKLERHGSRLSLARRGSIHSNVSIDTIALHLIDMSSKQIFTKTGSYKSNLVAIKKIPHAVNVNKPLLLELKRLRDLQNDHVARFIGLCIDQPNQCILTEYCQKGSLQDVLENEHIKMENMFKFSLVQDLVRAVSYIHNSEIKTHGNLKSSNCVVDSRFVLKVTDFGLNRLLRNPYTEEFNFYAHYRAMLWTAPELLRMENAPPEGTQKGDVYSFAIIFQEILHRRGPFWVINQENLPPEVIVSHVRDCCGEQKGFFRPTIHEDFNNNDSINSLVPLVIKCWAEEPTERPDFNSIKSTVKRHNTGGEGGNLVDDLLSRMEQYANDLESLVEERTSDYLKQKERAETLLYMMLPKSVAEQLMQGQTVKAEQFESVSIYFSDICGFTSLSSLSTPIEVVNLLNDLYTTFDSIIDQFDVYKVETIGDAYMVVSGLPNRNGDLHAREICRMALRLLREVRSFKIRHRPQDKLMLRIGIHSGQNYRNGLFFLFLTRLLTKYI